MQQNDVEALAQADSLAGKHEWTGEAEHHHAEPTSQWFYWAFIAFAAGVLVWMVVDDWRQSRKLDAEIRAWAAKVTAELQRRRRESVAAEAVSNETATSEAL